MFNLLNRCLLFCCFFRSSICLVPVTWMQVESSQLRPHFWRVRTSIIVNQRSIPTKPPRWALQYDWWSESVKKDPLTQAGCGLLGVMLSNPGLYVSFRCQAGLHFVGIGNYLITFPATSKYCGSASGVAWFFFALVSHQRSCPCREKIRVRFELAINWLCLSSCTYILCLSSCMYSVCQVVCTPCVCQVGYTSCDCHVLHLLFVTFRPCVCHVLHRVFVKYRSCAFPKSWKTSLPKTSKS